MKSSLKVCTTALVLLLLPSMASAAFYKKPSYNANITHNHGHYVYEPVEYNGRIFNCPCEIAGSRPGFVGLEFRKQEEIQDALIAHKKNKGKKPAYANPEAAQAASMDIDTGTQATGRVFYDLDDIFMQTTNKEEFEDFFKRYVSRKYPCTEVANLSFAKPVNGDLKILTGIEGTPAIISRNENANLYGIKIGSATLKYVQVPVRVEAYQFTNNKWIPIGTLKVLSEQTIKDDPRKIYKNAMNDAINDFTSPKDMVTQALFENGIKHRSVFDHVANW